MYNKGKQIIDSIEKIYWNLKKSTKDMDEHWYLANTWLKRYENTEASKERNNKLMNFIAYKDSHSFSVLDSPKSIRAFVLWLLYKELPEEAVNYINEFENLQKEIIEIQENNKFFEVWKEKNPKTFQKSKNKNDSDFGVNNLYYLARGIEKTSKDFEGNLKKYEDFEKRMKAKGYRLDK